MGISRTRLIVAVAVIAVAIVVLYNFLSVSVSEYKVENDFFAMEKSIRHGLGVHEEAISVEAKGAEEPVLLLLIPKELAQDVSTIEFEEVDAEIEILERDPIIKVTPIKKGQITFRVKIREALEVTEPSAILGFVFPKSFFDRLNEMEKEALLSKMAIVGQIFFPVEKAKGLESSTLGIDYEAKDAFSNVTAQLDGLIAEAKAGEGTISLAGETFNPLDESSRLEIESSYPEDANVTIADETQRFVKVLEPLAKLNDGTGYKYIWDGKDADGKLIQEGQYYVVVSGADETKEIVAIKVSFELDRFEQIAEALKEEPKIINVFLNKNTKKNTTIEPWCDVSEEPATKFEVKFDDTNQIKAEVAWEKAVLLKPFMAKKMLLEGKLDEDEQWTVHYLATHPLKDKIDLLGRSRRRLIAANDVSIRSINLLLLKKVLQEKECLLSVTADLNEISETESTAFAQIKPSIFFEQKEPIQLLVHTTKLGAVVSLKGRDSEAVGEVVAREHGWEHIVLESKPAELYFKDKHEFDFSVPVKTDYLDVYREFLVEVSPDGARVDLGGHYLGNELELFRFGKVENGEAVIEYIIPTEAAKEKILKETKTAEFEFGDKDKKTFYFEGYTVEASEGLIFIKLGDKEIYGSEYPDEYAETKMLKTPDALRHMRYQISIKGGRIKLNLTLYPPIDIAAAIVANQRSREEIRVQPNQKTAVNKAGRAVVLPIQATDVKGRRFSFTYKIEPGNFLSEKEKGESSGIYELPTYINGLEESCSLARDEQKILEGNSILLICIEQKLDTVAASQFLVKSISLKGVEKTVVEKIGVGTWVNLNEGYSILLEKNDLKVLKGDETIFAKAGNYEKGYNDMFMLLLEDRLLYFFGYHDLIQYKFQTTSIETSEGKLSFEGTLPDGRRILYSKGESEDTEQIIIDNEVIDFSRAYETVDYLLKGTNRGIAFHYNKTLSEIGSFGDKQLVSLSLEEPTKNIGGREIKLKGIDFATKGIKLEIDNREYPINLVAGKTSYNPIAYEGEYDRKVEIINPRLSSQPVIFEGFFSQGNRADYIKTTKTAKDVEGEKGIVIEGIEFIPKVNKNLGVKTLHPVGNTGLPLVEEIRYDEAKLSKIKTAVFGLAEINWRQTSGWKAKFSVKYGEKEKFYDISDNENAIQFNFEGEESGKATFDLVGKETFSVESQTVSKSGISVRGRTYLTKERPFSLLGGGAISLEEVSYPHWEITYSGPNEESLKAYLQGLASRTVELPIDESIEVGGKSLLLKEIAFKKQGKTATVIVGNEETSEFSAAVEEVKLFGGLALRLKSVPNPVFETTLNILGTNKENYRLSFLPIVKELREKVAELNEKETLSYLLILSNFFDLPAVSEVFKITPSSDALETKLAEDVMAIENLYYGNIDATPYAEVIAGRIPFSERGDLLNYFRNLPVARKSQQINFAVYPDERKIVLPERAIHQVNLTGKFPEIVLNEYKGFMDNEDNVEFVSKEQDMAIHISPTIDSFNELLTTSGQFMFDTHGANDQFAITYPSGDDYLSYTASNIPKMENRPAIIAISCNTGIDISQAFLKQGASVYVGAMVPVLAMFTYLPLKDELVSVGDEFRQLINASITEDGGYNENFEGAVVILGDPVIRLMPIQERQANFAASFSNNNLNLRLPAFDLDAGIPDLDYDLPIITYLTEEEKTAIRGKNWENFGVQGEKELWRMSRIVKNGREKAVYIGDLKKKEFQIWDIFSGGALWSERLSEEVKNKVKETFQDGGTFFVLDSPSAAYIELAEDESSYYIIKESGQPIGVKKAGNDEKLKKFKEAKKIILKAGDNEFEADSATTAAKDGEKIIIKLSYYDFFRLVEAGALEQPFEIEIETG